MRTPSIRLRLFDSEDILRKYDAACVAYEAEHKKLPDPKELYQQGVVDAPPVDLFDKPIYFDANCRARTEMISVREDEAKERIGSQKELPLP